MLTLLIISNIILVMILSFIARSLYDEKKTVTDEKKVYRIVVVTPSVQKPAATIIDKFIAHIKQNATFDYEIITYHNNTTLAQTHQLFHDIFEHEVDVLVTFGSVLQSDIYLYAQTKNITTPIVSIGSIMETSTPSLKKMQETINITGNFTSYNWQDKIIYIKKIMPHIRKIMLILDVNNKLKSPSIKESNEIVSRLEEIGVTTTRRYISDDWQSSIRSIRKKDLEGVDLVLFSRISHNIVYHAKEVTRHISQFNIPVVAPSFIGLEKGATFLGMSNKAEPYIGASGAQKVITIIEEQKAARDIEPEEVRRQLILGINLTYPNVEQIKKEALRTSVQNASYISIILQTTKFRS